MELSASVSPEQVTWTVQMDSRIIKPWQDYEEFHLINKRLAEHI